MRTTTSRAAADAASIGEFADSPQMICRTRLPEEPLPDGVEIRMVEDRGRRRDLRRQSAARAYVSLGSPDEATRSHFNGPTAMLAPHVHSAIAYLDGAPVSVRADPDEPRHRGRLLGCEPGSRARARDRRGRHPPRHEPRLRPRRDATSSSRPPRWASRSTARMGYEELHRREFRLAATHLPPAVSGRLTVARTRERI